ncbi:hypothetical protein SteCoe_4008 [Stentor coeruleus]|uniref:AAA+ ATPase domain-containing protein n=1 Tax=Stentor coeruleus TaxID=5963 RepID=A0A1R2BY65_9CILI|nr:hypothetical protein SteCoe_17930 [Stentor coeruleus]OMJ93068.1 hypothetical protein SteCoe_4008 [Stentor coeruleus]
MFRRVLIRSSQILSRQFASNQKPPSGFEKFFKKQEGEQTSSKAPNVPPDYKLDDPKKPKVDLNEAPKEDASSKPPEPEAGKPKETKVKDEEHKEERPKEEKMKDDGKKKKKHDHNNKPDKPNPNLFIAAGSLLLAIGLLPYITKNSKMITVQQLMTEYIGPNKVKKLVFEVPKAQNSNALTQIYVKNSNNETLAALKIPDIPHFLQSLHDEQLRLGRTPEEYIEIEYSEMSEPIPASVIFNGIINIAIFYGLYSITRSMLGKGGNQGGGPFKDIFNFNKSNFKVYGVDKKMNVSFKDVAGQGQAKKEITEFVEFLKNPEKFKRLGARMPRGALLVGPPGTGKTLLAKASAGEAGVPFFSISGSEFVEMFVGVGASRVRDLFKQAREKAPSIVFIDEIDAVGKKRDDSKFRNDERDTTLNQLLVEMDGFGTDTYVIVMAATNRQDTLDSALLRPGRFDRIVEVTLPDIEGRQEILKVHLNPLKLHKDFSMDECSKRVAALTPGFSGADLAQLCNEAAILAARKDKEFVDRDDFESASEKVMLGVESSKKLSVREKKIVSYHESGHAVAGWFLEGADPVLKVSVLPRSKGALGFAQNMPKETPLHTEQDFLDKICMILGGRVAEQIFFGSVTNGASDDLKKATQLAQALVENFGMSQKAGLVSYDLRDRFYSEATKDILESEVRRIINDSLERTKIILTEKKDLLIKLAERLIEKEMVVHKDLVEILGQRPFEQSDEYKKFISEQESK